MILIRYYYYCECKMETLKNFAHPLNSLQKTLMTMVKRNGGKARVHNILCIIYKYNTLRGFHFISKKKKTEKKQVNEGGQFLNYIFYHSQSNVRHSKGRQQKLNRKKNKKQSYCLWFLVKANLERSRENSSPSPAQTQIYFTFPIELTKLNKHK